MRASLLLLVALSAMVLASSGVAAACSEFGFYGANCLCNVTSSNLETDNPNVLVVTGQATTGTRFDGDVLTIVFTQSIKYRDTLPTFPRATGPCAALFNWTEEAHGDALDAPGRCTSTWTGRAFWRDVYRNGSGNDCGVKKESVTLSGLEVFRFTIDFGVNTTEPLPTFTGRDTAPERRVFHKLPFQIDWPAEFRVTSGPIDIFSPVLALSAIIVQEVVGGVGEVPKMNVQYFTSVQWPFYLSDPVKVLEPADITVTVDTTAQTEAESGFPCVNVYGRTCEQVWDMQASAASTTVPCTFNGVYSQKWRINCHPLRANDCPLDDATRYVTIQYSMETSDHCPQVVDTIDLSASLASYLEDAHTTPKDDFLHGQTIYWQVKVISQKASLLRAVVKYVRINLGANSWVVFQNFATTGTFGGQLSFRTTEGGYAQYGTYSYPKFSHLVDTTLFGLGQDAIDRINVTATIAVQYVNDGQASLPVTQSIEEIEVTETMRLADLGPLAIARHVTESSVAASAGVRGAGASGSGASSSSKSPVSIPLGIGAGAAFVVAAALVAGIVLVRRQRARKQRFAFVNANAPTATDALTGYDLGAASAPSDDAEGDLESTH